MKSGGGRVTIFSSRRDEAGEKTERGTSYGITDHRHRLPRAAVRRLRLGAGQAEKAGRRRRQGQLPDGGQEPADAAGRYAHDGQPHRRHEHHGPCPARHGRRRHGCRHLRSRRRRRHSLPWHCRRAPHAPDELLHHGGNDGRLQRLREPLSDGHRPAHHLRRRRLPAPISRRTSSRRSPFCSASLRRSSSR